MHVRPCPLVPEIALATTDELVTLWERAPGAPLPYWAIPWIGGQALARFVLDHPTFVAGKRVLDVGTGSGLVAVAATRAGGIVRAVDIDERALAAARANARTNGVSIEVEHVDLLDEMVPEDVILLGDLFYERALAARAISFCERHVAKGRLVLAGDPGRAHFSADRFELLARYDVPTSAEVEGRTNRAAGAYCMTR